MGASAPLLMIPLSTVEKFAYCPRQAYLQRVERVDVVTELLVEGDWLHRRVTGGGVQKRGDLTIHTAVHIQSRGLGVYGQADVVAFKSNRPYPVEYKRGKGRRRFSQHVQLCLQALCLEEMLGVAVPEGAIYHQASKRREVVTLDAALREQVAAVVAAARESLVAHRAPPAQYDDRCRLCSVRAMCLPQADEAGLQRYLARFGQTEGGADAATP
ncbi:CRISPR-associated protein Cas4 [Acanthopleuribacter pedis]|uniref:CRISPR-associated exonuclease Cas4 n=1 Tax=Acanthopleuribacter pedis TaxID=442870 RepID=A0A8J7U5L5_9BACT|nr:CRISPR-associated protein Cas4 [Acanthopleuribacter pedis]MBO1319446.1 CRISPR-associated protein Cas4 [Acanthopleuribacter pedis]